MAKLRHIAITVPDPEAAAAFYQKTFGMERASESKFGVLLSDGTVSLAILKFPDDKTAGDERGKDFHGLHHMGFVVDDLNATGEAVEANGEVRIGFDPIPDTTTSAGYPTVAL